MTGQPEINNFLRSLKPFVNQEGVTALEALENFFDLLDDPKVQSFANNVRTFTTMMREKTKGEKTETTGNF
ncbi:MAG TPA: hypothetical protein GX711_01955 [Clostridia bacterium]|nr:hypothetical protein [Clostridia bacterium]